MGVVGQRARIRQAAVDLPGDLGVIVDGQIVSRSDEEGGRLVDALPDVEGRPIPNLCFAERPYDQERAARLPPRRLGVVAVRQVETHPAIPHHGPEKALEVRVAGVVTSRHVLAVVLLVAKDWRFHKPLVGVDQGQLLLHDILHRCRHAGVGCQQPSCHGKERQVLPGRLLHRASGSGEVRLGRCKHGPVERVKIGDEVLLLRQTEGVVVEDVEAVEQSVGGDEGGDVCPIGVPVDLVDLLVRLGHDDKAVRLQRFPLGIREATHQSRVDDSVQIRRVGRRIRYHIHRHRDVVSKSCRLRSRPAPCHERQVARELGGGSDAGRRISSGQGNSDQEKRHDRADCREKRGDVLHTIISLRELWMGRQATVPRVIGGVLTTQPLSMTQIYTSPFPCLVV